MLEFPLPPPEKGREPETREFAANLQGLRLAIEGVRQNLGQDGIGQSGGERRHSEKVHDIFLRILKVSALYQRLAPSNEVELPGYISPHWQREETSFSLLKRSLSLYFTTQKDRSGIESLTKIAAESERLYYNSYEKINSLEEKYISLSRGLINRFESLYARMLELRKHQRPRSPVYLGDLSENIGLYYIPRDEKISKHERSGFYAAPYILKKGIFRKNRMVYYGNALALPPTEICRNYQMIGENLISQIPENLRVKAEKLI